MDGEPWHRGRGLGWPCSVTGTAGRYRGCTQAGKVLQRTEHPRAAAAERPRLLLGLRNAQEALVSLGLALPLGAVPMPCQGRRAWRCRFSGGQLVRPLPPLRV